MVLGALALLVSAGLVFSGALVQRPPGGMVIVFCRFAGEAPSSNLSSEGSLSHAAADYLSRAASESGLPNVTVRTSSARPATTAEAEAERARQHADLLWWGELGPAGTITAMLALDPSFSMGQPEWLRYLEPDLGSVVFPEHSQLVLPADRGGDPLVPVSLALAYLRVGDYPSAVTAARGAGATVAALDQLRASGQLTRLLETASLIGRGDFAAAAASALAGSTQTDAEQSLPELLLARAIARVQLGEAGAARADLDQVLAARDTSTRALARAHLVRSRANHLAGDLDLALADIEESHRLDPGYLWTRLRRAELLYARAQPDAARAETEEVLRKDPGAAPAHRLLGLVWLMLDRPDMALAPLERAKEVYSGQVRLLRAEEAQAEALDRRDQATWATGGILRLNRELATVYLYEGVAWADIARARPPETFLVGLWRQLRGEPTAHQRALASLQEASRLDPGRAEAWTQMAGVYEHLGDTASALSALKTAQEIDPAAVEPVVAEVELQEARGDLSAAIGTLQQVLGRSPYSYELYQRLFDLHMRNGDNAAASAALQQALVPAPRTPSDHLWRGKFLLQLGNRSGAEREFRAAAADPQLWEAHLHLGELLQEAGQYTEALAEFDRVLQQQPNHPAALLAAGRLQVKAGNTEQAERLFERLTSLAPQVVEGHIEYLELLLARGEIEKAVAAGQRAVEAGPDRSDAHAALARALEKKEAWPQAAEHFQEAVKRNPSDFEALLGLARALFKSDRYAEAAEASRAAIEMKADDPRPHVWLAESLLASGDVQAAMAAAGTAVRLAPRSAEALSVSARAHATTGEAATALERAREAAQGEQAGITGLLALGEVYLMLGRAHEALQAYRSAATIAPRSAEAMAGQGRAHAMLGQVENARQALGQAIELNPQFAEAYLHRGHTYREAGSWAEAFRDYRKAAELRPLWPAALYYLGWAYLERKELASAQSAFARAAQSSPLWADAWYGLGLAERDRGRQQEALAALRKATELDGRHAKAWLYLGLTYEELGDRAQARAAFEQAYAHATDPALKQQAEDSLNRTR